MTALTIAAAATLYGIAVTMEQYLKRYRPEIWEELNR